MKEDPTPRPPTSPPRLPSARPAARPRPMPKRRLRIVASAMPPAVARVMQAAPARMLPAPTPALPEPMLRETEPVAAQPQQPAPAPVVFAPQPTAATNALLLRGAHWEVTFGDERGVIEDCRGLRYIAILIRDAGSDRGPIHAKELVALASGQDARAIELEASERVLDDVARAQLVARITELGAERTRASAADDYDALAALDEEYDRLAEELSRSAAPKGGRGAFTHAGEKARKAVGKAVSEAIARIAANPDLPSLARHFTATIRKGQWLSYADSRNWQIDLPLPRR